MGKTKMSYIRVDPRKKVKMKVSAEAIRMAKKADDPLYKKYIKIKKKMFALRKRLVKRYGPKAISTVRKSMGLSVRSW